MTRWYSLILALLLVSLGPPPRAFAVVEQSAGMAVLQQARECVAKGDYNAAIEVYNQYLTLNPRMAWAYVNRGNVKLDQKDFNGAYTDFTRASVIDPRTPLAYSGCGLVEMNRGDLRGALRDYSRALYLDPKLQVAWINRGRIKLVGHLYESAVADFDHAIELDPGVPEVYTQRAFAKLEQGQFEPALADCQLALDRNPKLSLAFIVRGMVRLRQGDPAGAAAEYTKIIELFPDKVSGYLLRAGVETEQGRFDAALADATKGLETNPNLERAYLVRCGIEERMGNFEAALADVNRALAFHGEGAADDSPASGSNADPDAVESALAVLSRAPGAAALIVEYRMRGEIDFERRDWARAIGDWRHSLESDARAQGEPLKDFRQRDYVEIFLWMARTRLGEAKEASKELSDYRQQRPPAAAKDWPSRIMDLLLDQIDEQAFLGAAKTGDAKTDRGQHCEAWFYAGMKHLLANETPAAGDYFRKSIATGMIDFREYAMAGAELKALGQP
jgi:tetratricopeptide (TPR) repeat protein